MSSLPRHPARGLPRTASRLHSAAIHLLREVRRADAADGLGPARLSALSVLVFTGPCSLGELAAAEQVRPPTMSRIVRGLLEAGLATRAPDPADARAVRIGATPRGRQLLGRARRRRIDRIVRNLRLLPPDDLERLDAALAVLERLPRGSP